ncbi:MAG: hypothetical protein ABI621_00910 [Chloroflexota bacterium]
MLTQKRQDQGINVLSQTDYLPILIASFLTDRKSQGFADETVKFYKKKLKYFSDFCEGQAVTQISQLTADLIRRYLAQTDQDVQIAHMRGSPVDGNL